MNEEPLADKVVFANDYSDTQRNTHLIPMFEFIDIKRAVEWLKDELCEGVSKSDDQCKICKKIDEAFEDVIGAEE